MTTDSGPRVVKKNPNDPLLSEQEAEANLRRDGYEVFRWYDVPGAHYPKHRHTQNECLWVLSGKIKFSVTTDTGIQEFWLEPGDKLYLPSGCAHTAEVPTQSGVTYLVGQKS